MKFPAVLLCLGLLIGLSSCASRPAPVYTAKAGRVLEVTTERTYREPSAAFTAGSALRGGLIGAVITRGATGNAIGAATGLVIGALLGNAVQEADAEHLHRYTLIKLESGELCEFSAKGGPRLWKGARVYVLFDQRHVPVSYQKVSDD